MIVPFLILSLTTILAIAQRDIIINEDQIIFTNTNLAGGQLGYLCGSISNKIKLDYGKQETLNCTKPTLNFYLVDGSVYNVKTQYTAPYVTWCTGFLKQGLFTYITTDDNIYFHRYVVSATSTNVLTYINSNDDPQLSVSLTQNRDYDISTTCTCNCYGLLNNNILCAGKILSYVSVSSYLLIANPEN